MKIFFAVVSIVLIAGCSAFDKSSESLSGFSPSVSSTQEGKGTFDGTYTGEMTLAANECEDLTDEVGTKTSLTLNVIQSSDSVSVAFEDGAETSGTLDGNKTTVVKRDVSSSQVLYLEFTDTAITGSSEYIEGAPLGGQLGTPCATYTLELTKS